MFVPYLTYDDFSLSLSTMFPFFRSDFSAIVNVFILVDASPIVSYERTRCRGVVVIRVAELAYVA